MRAKRLLSLALALFMLFSLSAPSFAWAAEEAGHGATLVESSGQSTERVRTHKVTIRVSPSKAKAKVYIYDRRDDGNYADAQGTKYKSGLKLPAGDYHYIATAKGYLPAEGDFTVADKNVRIKVTLQKEGQSAPTAETQPTGEQSRWALYAGFYLVEANLNPDPDAAVFQPMPENMFVADPGCLDNEAGQPPVQYKLTVKLEQGAIYKVIQYADTQEPFPAQEIEYTVAASGPYTVYFRPNGTPGVGEESDWTNGVRFVLAAEPQTYYAILVEQSRHGNITSDVYTAKENDTVTLNAQPDDPNKYELDYFTVDGNAIDGAAFSMPAHDVLVSAVFRRKTPLRTGDYTITWLGYDGAELGVTSANHGEYPFYPGVTPTKPTANGIHYIWTGWTPAVETATADATYTATFTEAIAKVGNTYYEELDEAVGLAPDGSTVVMLQDVEYEYPLYVSGWDGVGRSITLDLGSSTLTVGSTGLVVENGCALTVTGNGTLNFTNGGAITGSGTCTITGGTFNFDPSAWVPSTGYQVTLNSGLWTVTPTIATPQTYTVTAQPIFDDECTVTGGGVYDEGASCTVTATALAGYAFTGWHDENSDLVSTDNPYTFTVTRDVVLRAYSGGLHSLTATCYPAEGGGVVGTGTYAGSKKVTLRAVPAPGYRFKEWQNEDGDVKSDNATYTFEMPNRDYALTAVFEVDPNDPITEWNDVTVVVQGDPSKISLSLWTRLEAYTQSMSSYADCPGARYVPLIDGRCQVPVGELLYVELVKQSGMMVYKTSSGGIGGHSFSDNGPVFRYQIEVNGSMTMTLILDPVYLTLQPNGPEVNAAGQDVPANWRTPIMANPFTWEGHTFTGWNTAADGSGTPYADGASVTLTAPLTLYAQWQESVAEVDGVAYGSLEDAVGLAPNGSTVVMLQDVDCSGGLYVSRLNAADRAITLDLGSSTLALGSYGLVVEDACALTITGAGTLTFTDGGAITGSGTCTITGGTFNFDPTTWLANGSMCQDNGNGTYSVYPCWTVTFDLQGGTYTASGAEATNGPIQVKVRRGGLVEILRPDPERGGVHFAGWYRDAAGKVAYDFSDPVTQDMTLYARWVSNSVYCTVSLSLKDSIDINLYVKGIPTADAGSYTVVYTFKGKTTTVPLGETTPYSTNDTAGTSVYRFAVASCTASEMTEEVVFDVVNGGASALTNGAIHYSIQQYCDWVLNSTTEATKLNELCQAALDYGTYAQARFGSANTPANTDHVRDVITGNNWSADDRDALAVYRGSTYRSIPSRSEYPSWLARITCSLSLKSRTEMNFYYALQAGCSEDTFRVNRLTVGGMDWINEYDMTLVKAANPSSGSDRVRVAIQNIPASKLGAVIVLELEDLTKGGTVTLTYSPMTYAANEDAKYLADDPSVNQANVFVCRALYRYYKAALAFFEQNN